MELLLLTRGERVALLCILAAALYASPLLPTSSSSSSSLPSSLHQADASLLSTSSVTHASNDNYNNIRYITHGSTGNDNNDSRSGTYNAAWDFVYLYDDRENFVDNPVLQPRDDDNDALFSWRNVLAMATMRRINVYEPLGWLLKALVVRAAGMDAWAVRVATLMLHLCAGCVLAWASTLLLEVDDVVSRLTSKWESKLSAEQSTVYESTLIGTSSTSMSDSTSCCDVDCEATVRCADPHVAAAGSNSDSVTSDCDDDDVDGGDDRVDDCNTSTATNSSECTLDATRAQQRWLGCCLSALLFVVHPVHVEVVGWPSAQPYALAALFANLSLCVYVHGVKRALQLVVASERVQECQCERQCEHKRRPKRTSVDDDAAQHELTDRLTSSESPQSLTSSLSPASRLVETSSPTCQFQSSLSSASKPSLTPASLYLASMGSGLQSHDWVVAGLYLCSVLSKSASVLLPAAFVLVDALVLLRLRDKRDNGHTDCVHAQSHSSRTPHHQQRPKPQSQQASLQLRRLAAYVAQKRLTLAVLAAFVGVTLWSNSEDWEDMLELSLSERVVKTLAAPAWVARCVLWPSDLRVHYQLREHELALALTTSSPEAVLSLAALALWLLLCVWRWHRLASPQLLLATAYALVMLLPTSGLVSHGIVARGGDRYAYLPSAVAVPFGGYALEHWLFGSISGKDGDDSEGGSEDGDVCCASHSRDRASCCASTTNCCPSDTSITHCNDEHCGGEHCDDERCGDKLPRSKRRAASAAAFGAALCTLLLLSTNQLNTWRNEQTLYAHSLSIDPTDWRMYSWLAKVLANSSPSACDADPQRCQRLWQLARHFAPTRSLTAQLFRAKILAPLGAFDHACDAYEQLLQTHPASPPVLSNVGVCRLLRGEATIDDAGVLIRSAAHAPVADRVGYAHGMIGANLKVYEAWVAAFRAEHGNREPTPAERMTFVGWVLV